MDFELATLEGKGIPGILREIPQPPKKLYIAGVLPPESTVYLAVVGSRKATTYGKDVARKLISGLRGYPIAIVSGLALGIDAVAHEEAMGSGLKTIVFPGSGLSAAAIYPKSNIELARRVVANGGCLISEFEPNFKAELWSFPMRNRLMAGISKAILVIEAGEKSGTLITARMALDYGREVLAVPGPINSLNSVGTNKLIRDGATPITKSEDILEALGFKFSDEERRKNLFGDALPEEKKILKILAEPMSRDDLIREIGLGIAEANAVLSQMEIKGLIREELGEIRAAF